MITGTRKAPTTAALLMSFDTSDWLKMALHAALRRDPVDAARDADMLAAALARHADEATREPKTRLQEAHHGPR